MKMFSASRLAAAALVAGSAMAQVPDAAPPAAPKSTVSQAADDASITSKVRDILASDSQLKDLDFTVETNAAVVTLNGTAANREQIARALALARSVDGVKGVTNVLAVRTS